ncbi:MAG TPA: hypothetical protein VFU22_30350 [Roseiflexaceae bacterium]|nr:hypothetical protein [Roseiflexaceae bacterium]
MAALLRRLIEAAPSLRIVAFAGGLARFSQMNPSVIFGPGVLVPLLPELVAMPLLYVWLSTAVKQGQVD